MNPCRHSNRLLDTVDSEEDLLIQISSITLPLNLDEIDSSQNQYQDYAHHHSHIPVSNDSNSQEGEGYVDGGELVVLEGNLSATQKQDALSSLLFVQLASDFKYSRTAQPEEWSKNYGTVIGRIGWVLVESSFKDVEVDDFFEISTVVLNQFENKFSSLEEKTFSNIRHVLNSLRTDDQLVSSFYNKSSTADKVNFGVNVYNDVDDDGVLEMFALRVVLNVCEMSKSYLFHIFESECVGGKIHVEFSEYKLNERTYSNVRKTIQEKLGNRMGHYVMKIEPL